MRFLLLTLLVLPALLLAPIRPTVSSAACGPAFFSPIGLPYVAPTSYVSNYAPVHNEKVRKVLVVEEHVVYPFAASYELFQFVAPITTPPPVLIAAPAPVISGSPGPGASVAAISSAGTVARSSGDCQMVGLETRLTRIEAALLRLGGSAGLDGDDPPSVPGAGVVQGSSFPALQPPLPATTATPNLPAVVALFQERCAQCHTAPGRDGIDLFNSAGAWAPNVPWSDIYRAVRGDKMPRTPAGKLTADEKALVKAMADAEANGTLTAAR